jgi:hypothetical protein
VPAQIQPALQAWEGFAHELTPAHVHVVPQAAPLQLESGPQAEEVLDGEALDATEDVGQAPTLRLMAAVATSGEPRLASEVRGASRSPSGDARMSRV